MAHHVRELSTRLNDLIGDGASHPTPLSRAKNAIVVRHRRKGYFDDDLFADPAWDMLLHLFVAYEEKVAISVNHCCITAGVPEMAALRWVAVLEERGLITIAEQPGPDRRRMERLTDPAHHAMRDFLAEQAPI